MPARTANPLPDSFRPLLQERGVSLRDLGRCCDVSEAHLSRVLNGVGGRTPSGLLAARIARALDLPDASTSLSLRRDIWMC